MTCQGSGGHQEVQGAPGGSSLPQAPRRVIKQTNNDSKPWFIVPKVCCDLKGMVFTHLGPLGCITTAIFSENAILSKTAVQVKKRLAAYAGETIKLLDRFIIFLSYQYVGLLRKIIKNNICLVKFGCVNG